MSRLGAIGIDPDDIGLSLPPAGPSEDRTTAYCEICYVINAKIDQAKKDAAWEYIKYYCSKECLSSYFENLATKALPTRLSFPGMI